MENKELFELTNPQKSIWLTEQYYPNSNINNVCGVMSIFQAIDLQFCVLYEQIICIGYSLDIQYKLNLFI